MSHKENFDDLDRNMRRRYARLGDEERRKFALRKDGLWKDLQDRLKNGDDNRGNTGKAAGWLVLRLPGSWPDVLTAAAVVLVLVSAAVYAPPTPKLAETLRPGLVRMAADIDGEMLDRRIREAGQAFLKTKFGYIQ